MSKCAIFVYLSRIHIFIDSSPRKIEKIVIPVALWAISLFSLFIFFFFLFALPLNDSAPEFNCSLWIYQCAMTTVRKITQTKDRLFLEKKPAQSETKTWPKTRLQIPRDCHFCYMWVLRDEDNICHSINVFSLSPYM